MRWLRVFVGIVLSFVLVTSVPAYFVTSVPAAYAADPQQPDWVVQPEWKEFVLFGSRKSNKFHRPTCQYVQRIKAGNVVGFRSREEAIKMGYVPCKVCRP